MTVQELAQQYLAYIVRSVRENGQAFVETCEDCPEELTELVSEAHGNTSPGTDDWRYSCIRDALSDIANSDDPDSPELEADTYDGDLLDWLTSSTGRRYHYVDRAVQSLNYNLPDESDFSLMTIIGWGQLLEMEEVYQSVLQSLKDLVDDMDE